VGPVDELCDGLDNDCDGETDDDTGTMSCGEGDCTNVVPACVDGLPNVCEPVVPEVPTCDAPPAPCNTTTQGLDGCGVACTKVGPTHCYTVHPACVNSNPGAPTNERTCTTPRGHYNCGLSCEQWPNTLGADCEHCERLLCWQRNGLDISQFRCNNLPMPPTP